jgi:hydroxyacylglutathione hydrolase
MQQHTIPTPYMVGDVHIYTAEIEGELVLFDTGPSTAEGIDYLRRHVDLRRLRHVLVTHCHIDHYGLAGWLGENTEAQIYLPRKDARKLRQHERRLDFLQNLLLECGFSVDFVTAFRRSLSGDQVFPPEPKHYALAEEADLPGRLGISILPCPGHSQSDLVYRWGNYAVTGDVLLRGIFQVPLLDVDLETFAGRFSNYRAYCSSLLELARLRGCRIMPGHRRDVPGLDETILGYVGKLIDRAARIHSFPAQLSVAEVVARLPGGGEPFFAYLKASEVLFMRDFLTEPERLRSALEHIGLFTEVATAFEAVA